MEFSVKVEGLDRIGKATKEVRQAIALELNKALFASAKKVEAEAKRSVLSGEKTGAVYQKYAPRRTHRASAPGQAPASDTGRLANSINGEMAPAAPGESQVKAGGGIVKYARMLEFGTVKMAARPFLFPALEKSKGWVRDRLNRAVRTAVINFRPK